MLTARAQTALRRSIDVEPTRRSASVTASFSTNNMTSMVRSYSSTRALRAARGPYQSGLVRAVVAGRSNHWLKVTNPMALAVKREAEEDWS
jgi:hypothetical protein